MSAVTTWLKAHWEMAIPLVAGACIGWAAHGTKVETRTVTEYKDRVVEKQVVVEKPVVEYRDRVITRVVTRKDGTKVETHVEDKRSKETGEKVTTTDRAEEKTGQTTVVVNPEGRWSVRALAGVDTRGSVVAGGGVDYRLVGPLTAGAFALAPVGGVPGAFTVGISLGARF